MYGQYIGTFCLLFGVSIIGGSTVRISEAQSRLESTGDK